MIFFDCDGTICESRQKISKEMKKFLSKLPPFVVIGGLNRERLEYQLDGLICTILAQSGNDTPRWQNKLTEKEKSDIYDHVNKIQVINHDMVEDRGCQVTFSLIGHHAPLELKQKYDPDRKKRIKILKKFPFRSKTLICKIAGTTCLDYTRKDGLKGNNIARWIKETKLRKKDCIYYGDALFKGGNDESVVGVIKTVAVKNPTDLLKKL